MKALGHTVIHYGCEGSTIDCDEHVSVTTPEDLEQTYGPEFRSTKHFFTFNTEDLVYKKYFKNTITEIAKRKQPKDFLQSDLNFGVFELSGKKFFFKEILNKKL